MSDGLKDTFIHENPRELLMKPVYVRGLPRDCVPSEIEAAVRYTILEATNDLAWLEPGQTVLLKPALNSPDPFPSTTHPVAVSATAGLLMERGARVVIGDQSGIEHVLHHPGGVIHGSTKENFFRSGIAIRCGLNFIGYEDDGWDDGFIHYRSGRTASWKDGYYITSWAKKADHIISLPRVSTHSQAGATLGFKNLVGMLREDSRLEFHANGPLNRFIVRAARGSTLVSADDGSGKFIEKIVEISDAVRNRLRLTLFVATKVQATFGPDRHGIHIGNSGLGGAYVVGPDPGLVFGSADPVAAETMALAVLKDAIRTVPWFSRTFQNVTLYGNPLVRDLQRTIVRDHPYIRHSIAIGLGELPDTAEYKGVPEPVRKRLDGLIFMESQD